MRILTLVPLFSFVCLPHAKAAAVAITGYTYLTAPDSSSYNDVTYTGAGSLGELTDGIDAGTAWALPQIQTITLANVSHLVGWGNRDPAILFSFGLPKTIDSATVWIADSDNSAGVRVPTTLTVRTPDSSFMHTIQIFPANDPVGSGSTVPFVLSGFQVTTSELIIQAERSTYWTMFSEVSFSSIPEPASLSLLGLALGAGVFRRKRVR